MQIVDTTSIMQRNLFSKEGLRAMTSFIQSNLLYLDVTVASSREQSRGEANEKCASRLDLHVSRCAHSHTTCKSSVLDVFLCGIMLGIYK